MQQQTTPDAFADLAQTTVTLLGRRKVDLAGILDRQHMPTRARFGNFLAQARDQRLHRDPGIGEKS
jgi:hypothetical protein